MVANINARKLIELKKAEIKKEAKIQALSVLIDSLEINDQMKLLLDGGRWKIIPTLLRNHVTRVDLLMETLHPSYFLGQRQCYYQISWGPHGHPE